MTRTKKTKAPAKTKEIGLGFITELDRYLFGQGTHYKIFEKLGAHQKTYKGKSGMYFAVWAPHAKAVGVVGDFNGWDPDAAPMSPLADSGIYETFIPGVGLGELYKFAITTQDGKILFKADPYAVHAEFRPGTASITRDISGFQWKDNTWMAKRETQDLTTSPLSIYEVHLGSWRKKDRPQKEGYYTYMEAAHELADYVKKMGYTHILFAVGAWKPGKLDIPGDVAGAIQWMKGVKAGNIAVGGSIAVVGGGNTAMDAARLAKRSGAKQVTLVYRRTRKYMPADEHELALALQDGVAFAELAGPVAQADGVLKCEQMKLGEADASGRRSPVGTGEFFTVPCDLVISAVGEQVDDALMSANGIELDKKGRPAFKTNVAGVYAAGDATRGPATVVEGIADAARFAEEVIGAAHTYEIPAAAYVTKADAIAKKGTLLMSKDACCEGKRCLQCHTVCENCVDSCPNRANVAIAMADGSHQIVHVDKMCNECGNCTQFCPYASEPCHDKFTLFQTAEDMVDSKNAGVLFLGGDMVRVRTFGEPKDYDLSKSNDLPADLEKLIVTLRDKYSYLFA